MAKKTILVTDMSKLNVLGTASLTLR